jgi:hypothetical protein
VLLSSSNKFKIHYNNELHRVYDFTLNSQAVRSVGGRSVHLSFDLVTSGIGPLDRRLLRASLLLNGVVLLSDILQSDGRFEMPHRRDGRHDHMRLAFSQDQLPFGHTDDYLVVRLVTYGKLGITYQLNAWAYPDPVGPDEYHFFRERVPTKINLARNEVEPLRHYVFITH